MIEGLITNSVLGGVTGYITNNLAIKMLFKEYAGFGGVIEKEYKSFVENISILIEKDLINHHTLSSEINSQEFQTALKKVIETIIVLELPTNSGEKSLGEIQGYEKTKENIFSYIDDVKPSLQTQIHKQLKKESVKNLLSKEQYEHSSKEFYKLFKTKESSLNEILYDALSSKSFEELLSTRAIHLLSANLGRIIDSVDFQEFDGDINNLFNEIIKILNIDEIIQNVENSLGSMYIGDFVNDTQNISKELMRKVLEVIESKEGTEILQRLISSIINVAKEIDVSLFDILDKNMGSNIVHFVKRVFPPLLNDIAHFIDTNTNEIESRLNTTIDNVLDRSTSGQVIKQIKDIFMSDFLTKSDVVAKIKKAVNEYGDEAGEALSTMLLETLEDNTIGEIVTLLEEKNLLSVDMLVTLIKRNIATLKATKIDAIEDLLQKRVSDVVDVDLGFLKRDVIPKALQSVKEKLIYKSHFKTTLKREVDRLIERVESDSVDTYLSEINLDINIETSKYYEDINATFDFEMPQDMEYKEHLKVIDDIKCNTFYAKLEGDENYEKLKNITVDGIHLHLESLLSSNVSLAVSRELSKFEPSQIKDMVEGFMGKELKPINTLGTILGALAGAGYYSATLPNFLILVIHFLKRKVLFLIKLKI